MKKGIVAIIICVVLLNGCYYQPKLRPHTDNGEIWICDNPYSELYWDDIGQYGAIVIDGEEYEVLFTTSAGPQMLVFDKEMMREKESNIDFEYCLFRGHTTYRKGSAVVKVEEDFKNIFNGKLPTFNFKRYNKEEYLKNKEE